MYGNCVLEIKHAKCYTRITLNNQESNSESREIGTEIAFESLVYEYTTQLYRFIYRLTGNSEESEDLTQEVFLKVWKHRHQYNQSLSLRAWIFGIARNTSIDYLRKKKPYVFSQFDSDHDSNTITDTLTDPLPLPDSVFASKELELLVTRALDTISPDQKSIILLKHTEELTFEEIATILEKPMNTIKSQYRRGIMSLRDNLQGAPNHT